MAAAIAGVSTIASRIISEPTRRSYTQVNYEIISAQVPAIKGSATIIIIVCQVDHFIHRRVDCFFPYQCLCHLRFFLAAQQVSLLYLFWPVHTIDLVSHIVQYS